MAINDTKNLWESYNGKGFFAEAAEYSERANKDVDGNDIVDTYATKDTVVGATSQAAGEAGLVPAPAIADKDKYLKGDGTWSTVPEAEKNYSYVWDGSPTGVVNGMFHVTVNRDLSGYSSAQRSLTQVGRNGVLGYLLPEAVNDTIPVGITDAGNHQTYALKTPAQLGLLSASNPTSADANKVLKVDSNGTPQWTEIPVPQTSIYGDYIADESGQAVLGESGEQIVSESAVLLYDTFKGVKFGAARAVADQDGNVFGETYARKLLPATKAFAASVTVDNNRVTSITGVTGSVAIDITVATGECANTAVELTTGSSVTADSAVTVTVNGVAAGRAAATDGKISASKKYQVTCVGTYGTMAEFETANA